MKRLIRALQWQGCLSQGEAECLIRDWRNGIRDYGTEAVVHYGGPDRLLHDAIRNRHIVTQLATGRR